MSVPELAEKKIILNQVYFSRNERAILKSISLEIEPGKIIGIIGPSGVGKTTLLNLISGQIQPDYGQILVNGINISKLGNKDLFKSRRKLGMLFQNGALFTDLNVFENVAFPLREHTGLPESIIRQLVLMKLQSVGLRGARHLMARELSGGMARRVALARAVILDPEWMLYDEPFAGQDPVSTGLLLKLIKILNTALQMTSIIVSHNIAETCSIADVIFVMGYGQIIQSGSPKEILASEDPWVRQFLTGTVDGPIQFDYPALDYWSDLQNPSSEDKKLCWDRCKL